MRLKRVEVTDFRVNERTMLEAVMAKPDAPQLGADDCVCFISRLGTQLVFVGRPEQIELGTRKRTIISSRRLRLDGGQWNPLMLSNYAEAVGLKLDGLKKFEDHFAAR